MHIQSAYLITSIKFRFNSNLINPTKKNFPSSILPRNPKLHPRTSLIDTKYFQQSKYIILISQKKYLPNTQKPQTSLKNLPILAPTPKKQKNKSHHQLLFFFSFTSSNFPREFQLSNPQHSESLASSPQHRKERLGCPIQRSRERFSIRQLYK